MKKGVIFVFTVIALSLTSIVYAAKNEGGTLVQNKNQVKTQNAGENSQLQINTQEEESTGSSKTNNEDDQAQGMPKEKSPRSATAQEHMSIVAQKVEELLVNKITKGGIGNQVRLIAQEQKQAQDQLQVQLQKIDSKGKLLKSLFGPNYQALKDVKKEMEQNQVRIQQLETLKNQLTNQGDITLIQEMIQALTEQNTALQDSVSLEEKSNGLLGWLFKWFAK